MDVFTRADLQVLMEDHGDFCASIFMPTDRTDMQQNPIRLKNLLRKAEGELVALGMRPTEARTMLAQAPVPGQDSEFWLYQSEGLALYFTRDFSRAYRLPLPFTEMVVAGHTLSIKPVLPLFTGAGRFYILALSQNEARLLGCSKHSAAEIPVVGMPAGLADALKYDDLQQQIQYHTGTAPRTGGRERAAIFHGVGDEDEKDRILRYCRQVDAAVTRHLADQEAPLLLACVSYLQPIYKQANTYRHLMAAHIEGNPEEARPNDLCSKGWPLVESFFERDLQAATSRFNDLAGSSRVALALPEVVRAAHTGRVDTLFILDDLQRRQEWGHYDAGADGVVTHADRMPGDRDLLDDAAVQTLANSGRVFMLAPEKMPYNAPLLALLRY